MVIFLKIVENEIDVQLKKYKNLIQELLRDYEQNYISQSDYTDFKEKYMLQINQLNIEKEELLKIVLPSSVPLILANMKVNIGLCLVGVIIGEFIGARQGLGYLIIYGSQTFQ